MAGNCNVASGDGRTGLCSRTVSSWEAVSSCVATWTPMCDLSRRCGSTSWVVLMLLHVVSLLRQLEDAASARNLSSRACLMPGSVMVWP